MKKSLLSLLSVIYLTLVSTNAFANLEPTNFLLNIYNEEEDFPPKGQRTPSVMPVEGTIDFENHRIASSIPDEIISYELWDEDGETPVVSYATDYDLVAYMVNVSGLFQLRLVSSEHIYIGYIDF